MSEAMRGLIRIDTVERTYGNNGSKGQGISIDQRNSTHHLAPAKKSARVVHSEEQKAIEYKRRKIDLARDARLLGDELAEVWESE